MAHACNPSYSEGRDQEDYGSKLARANSFQDLSRKSPSQNRAGRVIQGVGPEFNPHTTKNKQTNKKLKPGVVMHICNPSTWEAEAGGS
jgi:hypothetical protein